MRVVQIGYGAVGKENVRQLVRRGHAVVGIVDRPEVLGQIDLAGLESGEARPSLEADLGACLAKCRPDVILQATPFDPDDMLAVVAQAAANRCDLVSINPIVDIRQIFPETYQAIDRIARQGGIRVLGVGAIPGFFSDIFPLFMTGVCAEVKSVRFRRVADFSKWGLSVMEKFGFGLTPERFDEGAAAGHIGLFRSLWQSAHLIAHELGWPVLDKEDIRAPLVSQRDRTGVHLSIMAGTVGGFTHRVVIHAGEERTIDLQVIGYLDPQGEDERTGMSVEILGEPQLRVDLSGQLLLSEGAMVSSSARMINSMSVIGSGSPGFLTTAELPLISCR